jgi:tetratricopeptide (TPR) repeat protein
MGLITFSLVSLYLTSALYAQPDGTYGRALYYYKKGNFEKAENYLKAYVGKNPQAAAYYLMGYALYKIGRNDEALRYFNEVYLIDPKFSVSTIDFSRAKK